MTQQEFVYNIADEFFAMDKEYDQKNRKFILYFLRVGHRNKCLWKLHRHGYTLIESNTIAPRNKKGNRRYILRFSPKVIKESNYEITV